MSDATVRLVERLRERLHTTRQRIYLSQMAHGTVVTCGLAAGALLLALLLEAYFWLPVGGRTLLLGVLMLGAAASVVFLVGRPLVALLGLTSSLSLETLARQIGAAFSSVDDRLVNLLHLAEGRGSISDDELRDEAIRDLGQQVEEVRFEELASFEAARQSLRWAIVPVAGLLLAVLLFPGSMTQAGNRLLAPQTPFEPPAPFAWTIAPGDSTVIKGQAVMITARAEGTDHPQRATLQIRRADETHVEDVHLRADSTHAFRHRRASVREALEYRIRSGRVSSRWFAVDVVNQPMVRRLQLSLEPPAYTGLPRRTLAPNVGNVSALPGTDVTVSVTSDSNQLAAAHLTFADGDSTALTVDGTQATGSFAVQEETSYQVSLHSRAGIDNANPIQYQIKTLSDERPSIELELPEAVADIEQNGQKALQMRMTDDYGFTRLRLYYRLAESRFDETMSAFDHIEMPLEEPDRLDQAVDYTWKIAAETPLDPVRGDVIEYYVQVWDNNSVAGYQTDKSATQVLRFPSLAQQYRDLGQEQESAESALESLQQEAESMRREFQSLQEDVRRKQDGSWDNQRSVEKLKERQQQMEEQVDQVSKQVESMTREMQQKNLVSEETLQMYEDLQQVVDEINSPELQKALQKLQEAMQNMDMQSMQEAMRNFDFNEQQYQERLQRTLELFKKLRTQQQLEEVARRTTELAEQERKLAEQTEKLAAEHENSTREDPSDASGDSEDDETRERTSEHSDEDSSSTDQSSDQSQSPGSEDQAEQSPSEQAPEESSSRQSRGDSTNTAEAGQQLAEQQERSREEMEAIQKQMEELRRQMEEMQQSPKQQLDKLQEQIQRQNLPRQMQENSEQLRNQQFNEAQKGQQSMQQQLNKLSEQMSQMQQSMRSQQLQVNIAGIRQALEDVLHLSTEQEQLRRRVDEAGPDSPVLRNVSHEQVSLSDGLSVVNDSLQQLSKDIPRMSRRVQQRSGEALRAMSQSVESLSARELDQSTSHQKTAMEHLNNLALDLSQLLEQLQNMQQSGSGNMSMQQMMKQLQQMAGQQQKLNEQIQQLLNDVQGNRLSQGQQERLQQMRRQQQQIRRQLGEIRSNSDARNKLLGDMEKIAEQMEESIRELRERSVSREMVERQQQILSRLLQAQKSLQTQGKEDQRTSQTGSEAARESPDALSPDEQAEQLRRDLLRALESGYAPDYEELIKQYFKVLQESQ